MKQPILNKHEMYRRQLAGELGNTLPQYMSLRAWRDGADMTTFPLWAVRFLDTTNDPRTRFNLAPTALSEYVLDTLGLGEDDPINISPMLDHLGLRFWGQMTADWSLWYIEQPLRTGLTWRTAFNTPGLSRHTDCGRLLCRQYMNENSYEDVQILTDEYPGHVIEFSCYSECVGLTPWRNTVIWEVRLY